MGNYPCDGCHASGYAECACVLEGEHSGVCRICHGSGWKQYSSFGAYLNDKAAVYPSAGSRIASAQSMMVSFSYNESVAGSKVTPKEAMANAGDDSYSELVNTIRTGKSSSTDSGKQDANPQKPQEQNPAKQSNLEKNSDSETSDLPVQNSSNDKQENVGNVSGSKMYIVICIVAVVIIGIVVVISRKRTKS